jgi:hypothetical protein
MSTNNKMLHYIEKIKTFLLNLKPATVKWFCLVGGCLSCVTYAEAGSESRRDL